MSKEYEESPLMDKVLQFFGGDLVIKTTGEKLKELREDKSTIDKKYTQANLEADTGISIQSIRAYETNKTIPESKNAKKLADFFGITVESLLNDHMDIVYLKNIQQTDYSKELGLSNKSIENIKNLPLSFNVFLENKFCISFISKIDLLINIKEYLYKNVREFINLLSKEYKDMLLEVYIDELEQLHIDIENYFKENANIYKYINYNLFLDDLTLSFTSLKDCKSYDEDFVYWCNNLRQIMSNLLDEIERTNKILKYEINTELSTFLNSIAK